MKIVLPKKPKQEESRSFISVHEQKKWHGWPNRGGRISLFQGIQEISEYLGYLTFIFEGQSIKFLKENQAKTWWKDHLSAILPKGMTHESE